VLTRLYKGETLQVKVLEHGVSFDGTIYTSLSAVAKPSPAPIAAGTCSSG